MTKKNGKAEFLRFIFSIIIILYHCGRLIANKELIGFGSFAGGYIGVEYFFVLSGFLMASSMAKRAQPEDHMKNAGPAFRRFMWGKIKRIFPYHLLAFIPLYIEDIWLNRYSALQLIKETIDLIPGFFLIQKLGFEFHNLNSVEWYISAMLIAMAVIFVISYLNFDFYSKCIAPLLAFIIIGWLLHDCGTVTGASSWDVFGYRCVWRAFAEINAGFFAYHIAQFLKKDRPTRGERRFLAVLEFLSAALVILYGMYDMDGTYDIFPIIAVIIFISISFSGITPGGDLFDKKAVFFLGRLSFPMYLMQLFSIYLVREVMEGSSYFLQFSAVIALTFGLSLVCLLLGDRLMKAIDRSALNRRLSA